MFQPFSMCLVQIVFYSLIFQCAYWISQVAGTFHALMNLETDLWIHVDWQWKLWHVEAGKGSVTVRDLQRVATAHDFTWTERELANMIRYFDNDGDGKVSTVALDGWYFFCCSLLCSVLGLVKIENVYVYVPHYHIITYAEAWCNGLNT